MTNLLYAAGAVALSAVVFLWLLGLVGNTQRAVARQTIEERVLPPNTLRTASGPIQTLRDGDLITNVRWPGL